MGLSGSQSFSGDFSDVTFSSSGSNPSSLGDTSGHDEERAGKLTVGIERLQSKIRSLDDPAVYKLDSEKHTVTITQKFFKPDGDGLSKLVCEENVYQITELSVWDDEQKKRVFVNGLLDSRQMESLASDIIDLVKLHINLEEKKPSTLKVIDTKVGHSSLTHKISAMSLDYKAESKRNFKDFSRVDNKSLYEASKVICRDLDAFKASLNEASDAGEIKELDDFNTAGLRALNGSESSQVRKALEVKGKMFALIKKFEIKKNFNAPGASPIPIEMSHRWNSFLKHHKLLAVDLRAFIKTLGFTDAFYAKFDRWRAFPPAPIEDDLEDRVGPVSRRRELTPTHSLKRSAEPIQKIDPSRVTVQDDSSSADTSFETFFKAHCGNWDSGLR